VKKFNKALIDPATGDIFFYNFFKKKWEGIYNAGFHDLHRQNTMNGLEIEFEKNFKMYHKEIKFKNYKDENNIFEDISFKKCKRSHFIRKGIEEGTLISLTKF
jgi:hypothetical protein